jgi:NAD/NADP transhydrogenase alpha subunit
LAEVYMRIGVPKEIKPHEYRVGLTPGSVREYVAAGHEVTWKQAQVPVSELMMKLTAKQVRSLLTPRKRSSPLPA